MFLTALCFFAGYSESTFLLWSVLAVSAMRSRRWAWAGFWSCPAALTRSQGIALAVPFLVEWWATCGPRQYTLVDQGGERRLRLIVGFRPRDLAQACWVGLIPAGWGGLALFMQLRFDRPWLFLQIQGAWHRTATWPWEGLWQTLRRISPSHIATVVSAHNLIELLSVLLFAALIGAGWRHLPISFSLYAVANLLLILVNAAVLDNYYLPLMSASRVCLVIFPCFITLAIRGGWEPLDRRRQIAACRQTPFSLHLSILPSRPTLSRIGHPRVRCPGGAPRDRCALQGCVSAMRFQPQARPPTRGAPRALAIRAA